MCIITLLPTILPYKVHLVLCSLATATNPCRFCIGTWTAPSQASLEVGLHPAVGSTHPSTAMSLSQHIAWTQATREQCAHLMCIS